MIQIIRIIQIIFQINISNLIKKKVVILQKIINRGVHQSTLMHFHIAMTISCVTFFYDCEHSPQPIPSQPKRKCIGDHGLCNGS